MIRAVVDHLFVVVLLLALMKVGFSAARLALKAASRPMPNQAQARQSLVALAVASVGCALLVASAVLTAVFFCVLVGR